MSHRHHKFCGCQPHGQTRSPWRPRPLKFDWLTELARCRNTGARGRSIAYARAREEAMRPTLRQLRMIEAAIGCSVAAEDAVQSWRQAVAA